MQCNVCGIIKQQSEKKPACLPDYTGFVNHTLSVVCMRKKYQKVRKPVLNVVGSALHVSLNIYYFCIHT